MTVGDVYGRLTVTELLPGQRARVLCECGVERVVHQSNVRAGRTRSCGCLHRELLRETRRTHGLTNSPEYTAWVSAKTRVTNQNTKSWPNYGGRGVRMAEEWLDDFAAFIAHIGPRPGPGYSIDRIDNERGYEPGNVRWATALEQRANRRPTRRGWTRKPFAELTPDGKRRRLRVQAALR